jgi:hypothetical protein
MISLILFGIAGMFNAIMDKINFNFKSSIFRNMNPMFWDVRVSWKNMWKWPLEPFTGWYYFGLYKPRYKEKFPYSTTWLVWTTDAWHLAKALMLGCVTVGVVLYSPVLGGFWDVVLFYVGFTGVFTYFYDYILK